MLQTAKVVTENHGGIFPNNRESLMQLSGIGPYTAAAIQAFVYDEPLLSFDTNLEKIFSRYYHGTRFQKLTKEEKLQIAKDFKESGISGRAINAACMDFGSLVSVNNTPSIHSPHPNPLLEGEGVKSEKNLPSPSRRRVGDEEDNVKKELGDGDYPFPDCKWHLTHGSLEVSEKKKKRIFPTKDASIKVVLHENHTLYYSSKDTCYEPFLLPPTEGDIRHSVQDYFRTHYHLELSVRPIHKKYFEDNKPFVMCNAQIQV